jgi:hypothetical protein
MLMTIKLAHTVVWALMVACILAIPIAAMRRRFGWALGVALVIVGESVVLALNGMRCPLTDLAARYATAPASGALPPNFDIFLPVWIALHNKTIFGTLFVLNAGLSLWWWKRPNYPPTKGSLKGAPNQPDCQHELERNHHVTP